MDRMIRDHCKILCPGGKKFKDWKLWFRYRGKDTGGTRECHAQPVNPKDIEEACLFVRSVINQEVAILGSPLRVALSGYSQGGCISLSSGLNCLHSLGLVVSQRGMLMQHTMDAYMKQASQKKVK